MKVLDLSRGVAASFATLLLAELGAEVIKIEPPVAGDPLRERPDGDRSDLGFAFLNRRKRSVTLDIAHRRGQVILLELVKTADALIEDLPPGALAEMGLTTLRLHRANRALVLTSITDFGQDGPHSGWLGSDLVMQAMGGTVSATGWEDAEPVALPGGQAYKGAGLTAAGATTAAVFAARSGLEPGVHLDIAVQECFPPYGTFKDGFYNYVYGGLETNRDARDTVHRPPWGAAVGVPYRVRASDGEIITLTLRYEWESFAAFIGLGEFAIGEWADPDYRMTHAEEMLPVLSESMLSKTRYEWFADSAEMGYTFAPIDDAHEVLASPQLAARAFFEDAEVDGRSVTAPRMPFTFAVRPERPNRAPRPGEHNREVYGEALGIGDERLDALQVAGVI